MSKSSASSERVEVLISYLLRWGVRVVWIFLGIAYGVNLLRGQSFVSRTDLTDVLNGSRSIIALPPQHIGELITGLKEGDSGLFVQFALLLLILLPAMRVALLLGHYLRKTDWTWSGIAGFVLSSMLFGTIVRLFGV